jgi:hypothetical protein
MCFESRMLESLHPLVVSDVRGYRAEWVFAMCELSAYFHILEVPLTKSSTKDMPD